MDVIEKARELGQVIVENEKCKRLQAAKAANDSDSELQEMIGEFNLRKMQLNNEFNKEPELQSKEKIIETEKGLKEIYAKIMASPSMIEFTEAKNDMDELLGHINNIIQMSISGEVDVDGDGGSCGGNCSSCGGCH